MNCQILPSSLFIDLVELGEQEKQELQFSCILMSNLELLEALSMILDASLRRYLSPFLLSVNMFFNVKFQQFDSPLFSIMFLILLL